MEKRESFELTKNVTGIVAANITALVTEPLQDVWKFQVPVGHTYYFDGNDTFSAYLDNTGEAGATSLVDVVIKDASRMNVRSILNEVRYAQVKEFADQRLKAKLDISPGDLVTVEEGEWICIRANQNAVGVATASYFVLSCHRTRKTLN